jgi:ectoine hydroxylase-related dioxygenase (phytanoyl-CoA dioxygenase family)
MPPLRQNDKKTDEEDYKITNYNHESETSSMESSDHAILEMLGLTSLKELATCHDAVDPPDLPVVDTSRDSPFPDLSGPKLDEVYALLNTTYQQQSICVFPPEFSIPANHIRKLTEELIWGGASTQADRTYETIRSCKNGEMEHRRTLTRLENFVESHPGWSRLCNGYLRQLISATLGIEMVLFKEKLNLKPSGGSGFAPHLDTPSLRVALGSSGPQSFCTVMVAIDDATSKNGCLRVCKGNWNEDNSCMVIQADQRGNPDAGGRAGAIPTEVAEEMTFEDIICKGGSIAVFNGWAPHRSAANVSPFPRRAVFLTYNPKSEGDFHNLYYQRMEQLRNEWREKVGLTNRQQRSKDESLNKKPCRQSPKSNFRLPLFSLIPFFAGHVWFSCPCVFWVSRICKL